MKPMTPARWRARAVWHDLFSNATFGDAILDRLVHHAHRFTLTGGSLRRLRTGPTTTTADW